MNTANSSNDEIYIEAAIQLILQLIEPVLSP